MNLNELVAASKLYKEKTNFDDSYIDFIKSIDYSLDLTNPSHRQCLLKWLNRWACRQFAKKYHDTSSNLILQWYEEFGRLLPDKNKNIWELNEIDYNNILLIYEKLKNIEASKKVVYSKESSVKVGATGASNILFALRPKSLIPWDNSMINYYNKGDSGFAYINYIKNAGTLINELEKECNKNGFDIQDLPAKINRQFSTLPKLIDEYNWVILTRKWTPKKSYESKRKKHLP